MTTNYPITDPAEIAKLPTAHYLCVDGTTATRRYGKTLLRPWSVEGRELFLTDAELADLRGGIAARLVPEAQYELIRTQLEEHNASAKAQLDQAMELLRQVQRWLQRGGTSSVAGRIDSFLAEQEPCQRCWGEGKEERAIVDFSSATQTEPCPDCNLSDDHRMIEEEMNDA